MSTLRGQFTNPIDAASYLFAGKATITLRSRITGARYTYKICLAEARAGELAPPPHFVKVLQGPDNEHDFGFLGTIFGKQTYRHGQKSKIGVEAPSSVAFHWFFNKLMSARTGGDVLFKHLEVWHEGVCGRCGRKLTVPESVARGLGPICDGAQEAA